MSGPDDIGCGGGPAEDLDIRQRLERAATGIPISRQEQIDLARWALARLPVGDDALARIEQVAREATPGPWTTVAGERSTPIAATYGRQKIYADPPGGTFPAADQRYIAAASPDVILGLIARVRAAESDAGILRLRVLEWRDARCSMLAECDAYDGSHDAECATQIAEQALLAAAGLTEATTNVPHVFAGDGHDCARCGEGRQFYQHTDREDAR